MARLGGNKVRVRILDRQPRISLERSAGDLLPVVALVLRMSEVARQTLLPALVDELPVRAREWGARASPLLVA